MNKNKIIIVLLTISLVIIGAVLMYQPVLNQFRLNENILTVTVLKTGKSDCTVFEYNNFVMIIDTGYAENYEYIKDYLDSREITDIDYLILSHMDKDHIGSATNIISEYNVNAILQPDYGVDTDTYKNYAEYIRNNKIAPELLHDTKRIITDNLYVTVIPPDEESYDESNDYSLVVSIELEDISMLFLGDSEEQRNDELLNMNLEDYTVLKCAHHGDYFNNSSALLDMVNPEYAVITCKNENKPKEKLIEKLNDLGSTIYYNCNGNIVIKTDGRDITVIQ